MFELLDRKFWETRLLVDAVMNAVFNYDPLFGIGEGRNTPPSRRGQGQAEIRVNSKQGKQGWANSKTGKQAESKQRERKLGKQRLGNCGAKSLSNALRGNKQPSVFT